MNRTKYLAVIATLVLGITGSAFAEVEGWVSESPATHTMMSCCSNAKTSCSGSSMATAASSARKGNRDLRESQQEINQLQQLQNDSGSN
jgi:hypothetical protein